MAEKKSESVVREIKRRTRRKYLAEEKIATVLEGLRGEAIYGESGEPPREIVRRYFRGTTLAISEV